MLDGAGAEGWQSQKPARPRFRSGGPRERAVVGSTGPKGRPI